MYHDIGDCVQQLSGINLVPLAHGRPYFTLEEVEDAVEMATQGRVVTPVGAVLWRVRCDVSMGRSCRLM